MTRVALLVVLTAAAVVSAQSGADRELLAKIRTEGLQHSDVASVFETLTTDIGPRLTASPAHKRAAEFVRDRLTAYGLSNVHLEPWKFGRGWTLENLTIEMVEPRYLPLIGYADAWSAPTPGEIVASPVFAGGRTPEELGAMGGRLKGAIVMTQPIVTTFVRKDRPQPTDRDYTPNSAAYATSVGPRPATSSPQASAQRVSQTLRDAGA